MSTTLDVDVGFTISSFAYSDEFLNPSLVRLSQRKALNIILSHCQIIQPCVNLRGVSITAKTIHKLMLLK